MADSSSIDNERAHKFFSAHCFNSAWELIDKPERTPEENEQMIQRTMASLWHWTQREDCTNQKLSIGYWQAARVYALAGEPDNARKYARLCLDITPADDPFCLAYAHEALARAEALAGNAELANIHLETATQITPKITKPEDRKLLEADLKSLA
jgi:tetratricopeptide (TPR) repeat protein